MESVLEDIQEYIEKVTVNNTDKHLIIDRMDPGNVVILKYFNCSMLTSGVIKGRKKERSRSKGLASN